MARKLHHKSVSEKIFGILCSLKIAVLVILSLAASLAAGTIIESIYDTPTSQYWIYRARWFHGILALLGVNIFCVAMSRFPWKKRHTPFLLAHLGILTLLAGSWMTEQLGVDGNLRVSEGETASVVELDTAALVISESDQVKAIPIPWIPRGVPFQMIDLAAHGLPYDIKVDRFLTHADAVVSFVPGESAPGIGVKAAPAIRIRIVGGPMGISEDIWLWEGAPAWQTVQAGPAQLSLGVSEGAHPLQNPKTALHFTLENNGSLSYVARSSAGSQVRGNLRKGHIVGEVIHPGWKMDVTVTVTEWVPRAIPQTIYKPARIQQGPQAPSSAIHMMAATTDVWLGLGDRAVLELNHREISIGYYSRRFVLPFSLRLERFTVEHDQGTLNPASYASRVSVLGSPSIPSHSQEENISMNEPLHMNGYTIYQASYEDADPRPVTSIFAVSRDPGRPWKYLGSLLIVLGSILLFAAKYRQKISLPVLEA